MRFPTAAHPAALAALISLTACQPSRSEPSTVPTPATTAALRVYVPNQMGASVSVLDGTGRLLATVDLQQLGFSPHAMPHQVAAAPDGSAWYVALAGDGYMAKFDRENRLVAKTKLDYPGMVVLDPGRDRLYVSRALGAPSVPSSLGVFRASDLKLLDEPDVFIPRPHALAVDVVSGHVYTGSLGTNQIATLDPESGMASVTTLDGNEPQAFVGLAVAPDGRHVVATTQLTDRLLAFDARDPKHLALIASVPVGPLPYDVTYSPDGRSVWFPNQRANSVTQVDTRTWKILAVITDSGFVEPHGVAVTPDNRTVYVSSHGRVLAQPGDGHADSASAMGAHGGAMHDMTNPRGTGTLAVIDVPTHTVRRVTAVGPYAAALGLTEKRVR
jgi:DNA-binding beta-propeller fold protein YncE